MEPQYQVHVQEDISSTLLLRTDHQVLFSSLSQYQERVLEANNMELQRSTQAVEEEHNISVKDSRKNLPEIHLLHCY